MNLPVFPWINHETWEMVTRAAIDHRLDPLLVAAVVQTESQGNPLAQRVEVTRLMDAGGVDLFRSRWPYMLDPAAWASSLGCSLETEMIGQATGHGAMQVQGTVAREYGFSGWFAGLYAWETNLHYGCLHLQTKGQKYGFEPASLYAAYNAGSPRKTDGGMFLNQANVNRFDLAFRALRENPPIFPPLRFPG